MSSWTGGGAAPSPRRGGGGPAATRNLDRLAREGRLGLVQTVGPDIAPESDVAVMAMLGYDPQTYHAGRGPLEALGADLAFDDGDLALRGHFAARGATAGGGGGGRNWSTSSRARAARFWMNMR